MKRVIAMKKFLIRWIASELERWIDERALVIPAGVKHDWARRFQISETVIDDLTDALKPIVKAQLHRFLGTL